MNTSLVELLITAVGTEAAAHSVDKVSGSLGDMTRELGRMAVGALTAERAVEGVKAALEEGGMFHDLSLRVGESVRELVVLDTAFQNAGIGAGSIAQSANLLQKALGGVNELGGSTAAAFARLGTSIEALKPLPFSQQLAVLSEGFAKIGNQSERANVAMQIFGRSGGQMLQLLGDPEGLAQAQAQAGRLGERLEQDAAAFDAVGDRLRVVNARFREMWAVAAEQVLPTLNAIAHVFEGLNLSGAGALLGGAVPGALGMVAVTAAFDFADRRLYRLLENMQEGTARAMVRGVSNAMGEAALWTPWALAAGVTAQIILGVVAAWEDAQVQKIFAEMRNRQADTQRFGNQGGATDAAGAMSNLVAATKELQALETRRAELRPKAEAESAALRGAVASGVNPAGLPTAAIDELAELDRRIVHLAALMRDEMLDRATASAQLAANSVAKFESNVASLVATLPQLKEKNDKVTLETMDSARQAMVLQGRRVSLESQLAAGAPAGASQPAVEAWRLNLANQILELKKQEAEVNDKLREEAKKLAEAEQQRAIYALETQRIEATAAGDDALAQKLKEEIALKRAAAELSGADLALAEQRGAAEHRIWLQQQAQLAAQRQLEAARNALEERQLAIQGALAALDADYGRTDAEKWAARKKALTEAVAAAQAYLEKTQELRNAATTEEGRRQGDANVLSARRDLAGAQGTLAGVGANPASFVDQLRGKLTAVRSQMGTLQETIAGGFAQGFANASSGLQKLIGDTEYWSGKLGNIAGPIMGGITKAIADMFTQWIVQRGLAAAKNILFSAEEGTADTAAKAPGAVLTSISSFGVAAALGVAAIVAAMAAFGGFAHGGGVPEAHVGYTADVPITQVAGVVHGGEWVAPAWMVRDADYAGTIAALEAARQGKPGYGLGSFVSWLFPTPKQLVDRTLHPPGTRELGRKLFGGGAAEDKWDFTYSVPASDYDYFRDAPQAAPASASGLDLARALGGTGAMAAGGAGGSGTARNVYILLDPDEFARLMQERSGDFFKKLTAAEMRRRS